MGEIEFINVRKLIGSKNPKMLKWLPGFIISYLERILHQDEINAFMNKHKDVKNADFCREVIDYLNIDLSAEGIENVPESGKIVFAMNHPLGGMDALALVEVLRHRRSDLRFIVNDLLMNVTNLEELFLGVDKHQKTTTSKRAKINDVFKSDSAVSIFPAGLVSRKTDGIVKDLEWKKSFVTLSKQNNRLIIPVYINGSLSNFFYRLANIRRRLGIKMNIEMLYLSNELFKQRNKKMHIIFGKPIDLLSYGSDKNDKQIAQEIKEIVYKLGQKAKL